MTAAEIILRKALVGSKLDSSQWNMVQAGLRNRAFFSSQVAELNILAALRERASEFAERGVDASEFRKQLRKDLESMHYEPKKDEKNTIKDLFSKARLDAILETNEAQARGWIEHAQGMSAGAFAAFPAQEFLRIENREKPRQDWPQRWAMAGGRIFGGRKIALKDDPVWQNLGDAGPFGNPYPPFDWGSGMGVLDVDRSEAVQLGLIDDATLRGKVEELRDAPIPDFNANLEVSDPTGNIYGRLKKAFQDQVRRVGDKIMWRQEVLRETLFTDDFTIRLGEPLETGLISKLAAQKPLAGFADALRGKPLTVDQTWRDAKRADGSTHLSHFFPEKGPPDNIPLTVGDMELLPSIWRNPDRVKKLRRDIFEVQLDAIDGSTLVAQIRVLSNKGGFSPQLWTLYKKIAGSSSSTGSRPFDRFHSGEKLEPTATRIIP